MLDMPRMKPTQSKEAMLKLYAFQVWRKLVIICISRAVAHHFLGAEVFIKLGRKTDKNS